MEEKNKRKNKSKITGIVLFWVGIVGILASLSMITSDLAKLDICCSDAWGLTIGIFLLPISLVLALGGAIQWFLAWRKER